jgi:hypothetical protein
VSGKLHRSLWCALVCMGSMDAKEHLCTASLSLLAGQQLRDAVVVQRRRKTVCRGRGRRACRGKSSGALGTRRDRGRPPSLGLATHVVWEHCLADARAPVESRRHFTPSLPGSPGKSAKSAGSVVYRSNHSVTAHGEVYTLLTAKSHCRVHDRSRSQPAPMRAIRRGRTEAHASTTQRWARLTRA